MPRNKKRIKDAMMSIVRIEAGKVFVDEDQADLFKENMSKEPSIEWKKVYEDHQNVP